MGRTQTTTTVLLLLQLCCTQRLLLPRHTFATATSHCCPHQLPYWFGMSPAAVFTSMKYFKLLIGTALAHFTNLGITPLASFCRTSSSALAIAARPQPASSGPFSLQTNVQHQQNCQQPAELLVQSSSSSRRSRVFYAAAYGAP